VLELIEERILLRRQDEFCQKKTPQGPRGQRTTALLEYFNLSRGDKNKTDKDKRLGLNYQRKANYRPIKRRDLEQRYRPAEEQDKDLSPRQHIENSPPKHFESSPIPEGQESKEIESQKATHQAAEAEWRFEFVDGKSSSSKDPGAGGGMSIKNLSPEASMEVHFKDVLVCPEKQRRRRSSFLMKKPRLLLRSEKAHQEIENKKKQSRSKGSKNKVSPALAEGSSLS
jgi:hypothetical protein